MRLKLPNKSNIISLSLGIVCALGNDPWALWHLSILSLIVWFWLIIANKVPKNIGIIVERCLVYNTNNRISVVGLISLIKNIYH